MVKLKDRKIHADDEDDPAPQTTKRRSSLANKSERWYKVKKQEIEYTASKIFLDRDHAKAAIQKRHIEKQALFSIVNYVIFIAIYVVTVLAQFKITDSYELEGAMTDYLVGGHSSVELTEAKTLDGMWNYLENGILKGLFPEEKWYNGHIFTTDERGYLLNYNRLVSGFSLIQTRVDTNKSCALSPRFSDFAPECWPALDSTTVSTRPFGPPSDPEWYQPDEGSKEFRITFPLDADLCGRILTELKQNLWLDKNTRGLVVEFTIFNSAKQLFCRVQIAFDHKETGMIDSSYTHHTLKV